MILAKADIKLLGHREQWVTNFWQPFAQSCSAICWAKP